MNRVALLSFVTAAFLFLASPLFGEQLIINLSDGSVIKVEAGDQTIDWKTIGSNGSIKKVSISLSQVNRIDLTDRPASVQIARVRSLLDSLDHDDYQTRVNAQSELSKPSVGRRFKNLVTAELQNESLEVRVRVRQILKSFSQTSKTEKPEYDYLYLKDGKTLVGDVGEFALKFNFRDQDIVLKREYLRQITKADWMQQKEFQDEVSVKLLHRHREKDYAKPERVIDFETDQVGEDLAESSADVSRTYVNRGVIFEAERKGFIGTSGYPFKFQHIPADEKSVCVVDLTGAFVNRFRGVVRVSFCEPGLPDQAAGVYQFGVFASRIDSPRDLIMEAYNAQSQLIATTEATDDQTVFLGVETNEPIAFIRILTNPYLFEVGRNVDETYVLDHIWFGEPTPLRFAGLAKAGNDFGSIQLKSGDLLTVEDVQISDSVVKVYEPQLKRQYRFEIDEIDSIRFGGRGKPEPTRNTITQLQLPDPLNNSWMVMLPDRTVLKVDPGEKFSSLLFEGLEFDADQILGVWAGRDHVRFPMDGDFKREKPVLVFPTCRVVADLDLNEDGMSWEEAEKIEQPVFKGRKTEDVTPKFQKFEYEKRRESQMPTVWFKQPRLVDPNLGMISLVDGQKIMLGSDSGFRLGNVTNDEISVKGPGELEITLPMSQVIAIKFPK